MAEEKETELPNWAQALRGIIPDANGENIEDLLRSLTVDQITEVVMRAGTRISLVTGTAFATLQDVFPDCDMEDCDKEDYSSLIREWNDDDSQFTVDVVREVYTATRQAAQNTRNRPSVSGTTTTIQNYSPVRLTGEGTRVVAEEAYLCPATGTTMKCDTWLYIVAAVLGLPSDTKDHRECIIRAIRGSYPPTNKGNNDDEDMKKKPTIKTMDKTGINRCPFNLLAFAAQKSWFDVHSGVIILPIMTMEEAKGWDGGPYSVIVLCNNGKVPRKHGVTAADIACNIGLNLTEVAPADDVSEEDLGRVHGLLKQAIKACAFCLESKEGPAGPGMGLWYKFREKLTSVRVGYSISGKQVTEKCVPVPVSVVKPTDKHIVKIDLGMSHAANEGDEPVYPDPMLLIFKSSVNWTREYDFQLIAEAEAQNPDLDFDRFNHVFIPTDDKSAVSGLDNSSAARSAP